LGEELEVDISECSPKEGGIVRIQGFVIYASYAKVVDRVKINIIRVGNKAVTAEIIKPA
jgi:predicted RNA-binding protein with TRAM domain